VRCRFFAFKLDVKTYLILKLDNVLHGSNLNVIAMFSTTEDWIVCKFIVNEKINLVKSSIWFSVAMAHLWIMAFSQWARQAI